jgi:hypothetical protein
MGKNDAGNEVQEIGPRSDYFGEALPWYRLEQKNGSAGLLVDFARVLGCDGRIGLRDSPVCRMVGAF